MKNFVVIIIAFVLLISCQRGRDNSDIFEQADALVCENPDSSLIILEKLDFRDMSASEKAHYALLFSKGLYKSGVSVANDSLTNLAAEYYKGYGDSLEYQSLFYKGVVQGAAAKYDRALLTLMTAADLALAAGDYYYHGLAVREQANIYGHLLAYPGQIKNAKFAIASFEKSGHAFHEVFERINLANGYASASYPDSALSELEKVKQFEHFDSLPELQTAY